MAPRVHPFPSRTRKLSWAAPKILGWRRPGKIGRRRHTKISCPYSDERFAYSSIAQSVEHSAVNRRVVGSSPTWGAKQKGTTFFFWSLSFLSFCPPFSFPGLPTKTASNLKIGGDFLYSDIRRGVVRHASHVQNVYRNHLSKRRVAFLPKSPMNENLCNLSIFIRKLWPKSLFSLFSMW